MRFIIGPNPSNREEWLAARQKLITSTTVARIMRGEGFTVYHELIGDIEPFAGNRATRRGNRFQRPTLEEYAEEANAMVMDGLPLLIDPDCPSLAATPDAVATAVGNLGLTHGVESLDALAPWDQPKNLEAVLGNPDCYGVEAKTSLSPKVATDLAEGEEGSDIIPDDWMWQTHCQMACAGWNRVDMAILLFGKLKIRRVMRNAKLIAKCREVATEYADRVARKIEPPFDPSLSANQDAIKSLYQPTGATINLTAEAAALWAKKAAASATMNAAKKEADTYDAAMRQVFGNAETGILPDGSTLRIGTVNCAERIQEAYSYTRFWYSKPKKAK